MADAIHCPACGTENPSDQRFCGSCGASLSVACPSCGHANPPGYSFCGACGVSLKRGPAAPEADAPHADAGAPREERRLATVLFADLSGFTSLAEQMDPEDVKALAHELAQRMGEEVVLFGGTVTSVMGDAIMAVFGAPVTHEDDAERAVRAALAMRDSITSETGTGLQLQLHIGINTGEVMAGLMGSGDRREYAVMGDVTNTAARLQSAAPPGTILVGAQTYLATSHCIEYEPVDPIDAKGKQEPVAAWRAVAASSGPSERPGSAAPFVGRQAQLDLLERLWRQVVDEATPRLVTIIGPPGIGKSRLIREFSPIVEPTGRVVKGRSLPYGETTGYDAFAQQVRQLSGSLESDPAPLARAKLKRLVHDAVAADEADETAVHLQVLMGLSSEATPDKQLMFNSVRRWVEGIARRRPTVLVFEDLHWAQPTLLDLIESIAARVRDVPLLVIGATRAELLDVRPTWGGGLTRHTAIPLEPLSERDAAVLASTLMAAGEAREAVEALVQTGGGNPLFLEELAASMADRVAGSAATLPTSVQAIIAARLDALPTAERRVLENASVVGRFFWRGAVADLLHGDGNLDATLDALEVRDFIRRQPESRLAADREFVFKHILTQEVAYQALPKAERRRGHAAVAQYLERTLADRKRESASLLAHHWEQAGDPNRAARYLVTAGEVASRAWAKERAIALFSDAMRVLGPQGDPEVMNEAQLGRAWARIDSGDYTGAAEDDIRPLLERARGKIRIRALQAKARSAFWLAHARGVHDAAEAAVALARELGDVEAEARSLAMLSEARGMDGDLDESAELADRVDALWPPERRDHEFAYSVTQSGVLRYWRSDFAGALQKATEGYELGVAHSSVYAAINGAAHVGLALTGMSRHEEAIGWFERGVELGEETESTPRFTSRALAMWAGTIRELGDLRAAREMSERALEFGRRAAFPGSQASAEIDLLILDVMEGNIGKADADLPRLFAVAEATKGWHQWLWTGRLLDAAARIELAAGRHESAIERAAESLTHARRYRRLKYASSANVVTGEALLATGKPKEAVEAFQSAVSDAELMGHAPSLWHALGGLARALGASGDDAEADGALDRARRSFGEFSSRLSEEHRRTLAAASQAASMLGGS